MNLMRRLAQSVIVVAVIVLVAAAFGYWQLSRLGRILATMPVEQGKRLLIGAQAARVLAPSLEAEAYQRPLLDDYRIDPELAQRRYYLVMTWRNANLAFQRLAHSLRGGTVVSTESLTSLPVEDRVDGWGTAYCVLSQNGRIVFLSSGGKGQIDCSRASLRKIAARATTTLSDSRLAKDGPFFVSVFDAGSDSSLIESR